MRKVTVCIVMTVPLGMNGVSHVILNYLKEFANERLQYVFLVSNELSSGISRLIERKHGKVVRVPKRSRVLKYLTSCSRAMKECKCDILHVHGNSATMVLELFAGVLANIKVRIAHSHNSHCASLFLNGVLKYFFQQSYTKAFACSKLAGDWLFGAGKFDVIPNSIDLSRFRYDSLEREKVRKELGVNDKFVVGHIGGLQPAKNYPYLIELLDEIIRKKTDCVGLLVGAGSTKESTRQDIAEKKRNDKIKLLGLRTDSARLYLAMDCFVLPSFHEGLPLVALEAQAAGLPCYLSENVTREVQITKLVEFCKIDEDKTVWLDKIMAQDRSNRDEDSREAIQMLTDNGYCIKKQAVQLESAYIELFKNI